MASTTRRTVLQTAALSPLVATPFVRGAYAAGKLSVGFWDHWVPGANVPLETAAAAAIRANKEQADLAERGHCDNLRRRRAGAPAGAATRCSVV